MKVDRTKESYLYNPYRIEGIEEREIRKEGIRLSNLEAVDPETGEATPLYTPDIKQTIQHDSKTYSKAFVEAGYAICKLTASAQTMFLYILYHLRPNQETVFLNPPDTCSWCGFSPSSHGRSVDELIRNEVIARKLGSKIEFFINPNILFNGDRVKLLRKRKQKP